VPVKVNAPAHATARKTRESRRITSSKGKQNRKINITFRAA
jgi:hypothetical protein